MLTDEGAIKEALAVAKTVVPFDIVPGVPIGVGTAAYAGVPVGPVRTEADIADVAMTDFDALAHAPGTLVLTVAAADDPDARRAARVERAQARHPDHGQLRRHGHRRSRPSPGRSATLDLAAVGMAGTLVVTVGRAAAAARQARLVGVPRRCTAGGCSSRARRIRPAP